MQVNYEQPDRRSSHERFVFSPLLLVHMQLCRYCALQGMQFPRDDKELGLLADYETCHAKQVAAAAEISNLSRSMPVSHVHATCGFSRGLRLKCKSISLAIRAHIRKKRTDDSVT